MRNSRKKDSKTTDKALKLLEEKMDSHKEYFALIKEYIKKLETSDEYVKENELATVLGLLIDEIDDLHNGLAGSCEVTAGLVEDRNTIAKWIEEYIKFRDIIVKILDKI